MMRTSPAESGDSMMRPPPTYMATWVIAREGRLGGEEDQIARPQRPLGDRPTGLGLQGGDAGQEDAEGVIDGVGEAGTIKAEG